ncbi:hypothetical protein L249_6438 [Ophiocordyceps polyrhachis-furcata BCC 54312]|uniref:Gfd2/YDR514C-like C-terminal domain-containing protein n=1 Tax=Ophiocordyceps polyrhachis-furcata BCC 54312 TaxID=1330021 RepID=A0A367LJT5_9HYPO|nr:hypothetical protein L249_6438 [Ophiocordyceps polyrhachis-furcata BCC 54312]
MADSDPDLSLLQDVLGRAVTLKDPGIGIENTHETATKPLREHREPRWEQVHAKEEPRNGKCKPTKSSARIQSSAPEPADPISIDCSALLVDDMVPCDVEFCPVPEILAYPHFFIGKGNRPRAKPFFDDYLGRQSWDIFWMYDPRGNHPPWPDIFLLTAQFEAFLRAINEELNTALTIPSGGNRKKFCRRFGGGGTPRPRFLLRSVDRYSLDKHSLGEIPWPQPLQSDAEAFKKASTAAQDDFLSNLHPQGCDDGKNENKKDKTQKAKERSRKRALFRQSMMHQAQTFLGLRNPGSSDSVVFVCVDVEALEAPPHPVSEVGIAILDTNRLSGTPPAAAGSGWWPFIEAHHLRTKEYSGMVNFKYVMGCPDAFDFGTSEFPTKKELVNAVRCILKPYMDQERKLVFVGHDTASDLRYLSQMGLDMMKLPGMVCEIDTKALHQAWQNSDDGRSLSALLSDLNIRSNNLHNAGNDAVFTMRAAIGLATEQVRKDEADLRGDGEKYVPSLWET